MEAIILLALVSAAGLDVASGFRFPGQVTTLGTFNAALLPQYPMIEQRAQLLADLVSWNNAVAITMFHIIRVDTLAGPAAI